MPKGDLLLKPQILFPVIICMKTLYCGGLAWQTRQGGKKCGGKLMGQDKDILAAEGRGAAVHGEFFGQRGKRERCSGVHSAF